MHSSVHTPSNRVARSRRRAALTALSLVGIVSLAACGTEAATANPAPDDQSTGGISRLADDATVFAITDHGGLVPVDAAAGLYPRLVVTADGTVYRPGSVPEIFPGPIMPQLEVTVLDDDDRSAVFAAIDTHIDELTATELPHPGAADAAFTELVLRADDELVEVTVPALTVDDGTDAEPSSPAHEAAIDLVTEIESIVDGADEWELRAPDAVRITSISYDEEADPGVGPAIEFPLDGAAIAPTEGLGCLDLTGTDLEVFTETIEDQQANATTPWMTQGRLFQLIVRPVFSHEAPCDAGPVPAPAPAPAPAQPTPTTPEPTTPTTGEPITRPPTTNPPTTQPPTPAVADGAGCNPGVGALTDGRWYGIVTEVMVDAIDFDLACWFSGDNAVKAAAEDGQESPPPNDYYVRNTNPDQRTILTGSDTMVTWYPASGDPGSQVTTSYAEWVEVNRDGANVWITIRGGIVVDIAEQWTP